MKPVLALTLSTQRAQIALVQPEAEATAGLPVLFRENSEARRHSEWLLPATTELLESAALDFSDLHGLAVDIGPGSFTGLRVGFQTVQALCYAQNLPCFTASSLDILCYGNPKEIRVFALINAFRNLVYFKDSAADSGPEVLTFEEATSRMLKAGPSWIVGDAYPKLAELRQLLGPAEKQFTFQTGREYPRAEDLARMSVAAANSQKSLWTKDWNSISPLYLRGSEAEEKLRLK